MCDDDIKSCPMNQSPSDILEASNETVSISIATADRLCVASGTVRVPSTGYRQGTWTRCDRSLWFLCPMLCSTQDSIPVVLHS